MLLRQIVDLANPANSVGIYPGGQSENPASPFYADQMRLWAKGEYLPLHMVAQRSRLPATAKATSRVFKP